MSNPPLTYPLTHEAAFPEVGALALGALPSDEARLVRAHVENCPVCSAEFDAMTMVVTAMSTAPRGGVMAPARSAEIRGRLMARAAEGGARKSSDKFSRMFVIAAAVAMIALGLGYYNQHAARQELIASAARRDLVIAALNALVRERDAEIAAITGPTVSVMELSSTGTHPPTARMFWDKATNRWTLFAHGLPAPKAGRTYELWLVTADKKIPAGIFKPRGDGSAVVRATYAMQPADLKAIAITDEPDGGVSAPTGAVVLAARTGS